jgi:hypothetical protein
MIINNQDNKLQDLESRIKKLEEENQYLLEELSSRKEEITDIKNDDSKISILKDYSELVSLVKEANEISQKAITEVDSIQKNIFSIMALFFGIFTFISIDLSFTKGIMDRVKYFNNLEFIITFLFIQGLFFVAVYYFLLKPFLNTSKSSTQQSKFNFFHPKASFTSNPSTQQSSKVKKIFIFLLLLLLVFLGIVFILNYNSISQKNSIVNNPNSNNTFKATEELKKPPLP